MLKKLKIATFNFNTNFQTVIKNLQSEGEQSQKTMIELKDEIKRRDLLIKDKEENIKKTLQDLVVEKSEVGTTLQAKNKNFLMLKNTAGYKMSNRRCQLSLYIS